MARDEGRGYYQQTREGGTVRKIGLDSEAENCRRKCVQREQLEVVLCLWHENPQRAATTMGVAVW